MLKVLAYGLGRMENLGPEDPQVRLRLAHELTTSVSRPSRTAELYKARRVALQRLPVHLKFFFTSQLACQPILGRATGIARLFISPLLI